MSGFTHAELFTGKLSITEGFSIAMFDYRRVFDIICVQVTDPSIIFQPASIEHRAKDLNQYPNSSRNTRNTLYRCAVHPAETHPKTIPARFARRNHPQWFPELSSGSSDLEIAKVLYQHGNKETPRVCAVANRG
jgi:hypothetical protein